MDVETSPPQPEPVVEAIAHALVEPPREPDPWWQRGVEEALAE
jgi:hypothetical protein